MDWSVTTMNSMKLVIPLHLIWWKKTQNDAVTLQSQSQFTPKMKANAVPRLLSSLVWIDQYYVCNGMTSFMEFMFWGVGVSTQNANNKTNNAQMPLTRHYNALQNVHVHCIWNSCIYFCTVWVFESIPTELFYFFGWQFFLFFGWYHSSQVLCRSVSLILIPYHSSSHPHYTFFLWIFFSSIMSFF